MTMDIASLRRLYRMKRNIGKLGGDELKAMEELEREARRYIASVEDDRARAALYERYILAKPWERVAQSLGFVTPDSLRKLCERTVISSKS